MTDLVRAKEQRMSWIIGIGVIVLTVVAAPGMAQEKQEELLAEIRAEIIPEEGIGTEYGLPLSLDSLPQFVDWWYTIVPSVETDARYIDALSALVAPCCDDNLAFKCCCENDEGQACNIIRSGKGLAAHLIQDLDFRTEQIQESVYEWFRFARPDYYLAVELETRGFNPVLYGLTAEGSCYRGMCGTPISRGGCGGMGELIEPAIESTDD
jgi:hypothetical protein